MIRNHLNNIKIRSANVHNILSYNCFYLNTSLCIKKNRIFINNNTLLYYFIAFEYNLKLLVN